MQRKSGKEKVYSRNAKGIIKLIYKKGDERNHGNYRGIMIMDTGYKIYIEWLRERLIKELEELGVLNRNQFGFRRGKGTTEAIYVLTEILETIKRKERGKIYVCFVDLKVAFDKIQRKEIWKRIGEKKVDERIVKRSEVVCGNRKEDIEVRGERLDEFEIVEGGVLFKRRLVQCDDVSHGKRINESTRRRSNFR